MHKWTCFLSLVGVPLVLLSAATGADESAAPRKLIAQTHDSGFAEGHDTYNGLSSASDGRIYYVLSTERHDLGARMFVFDPATQKIRCVGDLTTACGEAGRKAIVQGKSHVRFVENQGKLYFATHIGFYTIREGMETMGDPPPGYKPYPGGHLLAYDMTAGTFEDFGVAPEREGILTMNMDTGRGRIYGLTWPTGIFFRYDLARRDWKSFGKVCQLGERGRGPTYRTICRSIAVDPTAGTAYFTDSEGTIHRYRAESDAVEIVSGEDMRKDYFGLYDPTSPGHMGYNWRQVVWHPADRQVYGVHGNSGYLFRFDPRTERIEVLDRITSVPSQRAGMFDQFSYGYLGFTLGPDGRTLYYLTGGPIYIDGKRVAGKSKTAMGESKGIEDLHIITYDIPTSAYVDHGAIFYADGQRPSYVNSIAVGQDGTVYALPRITTNGKMRTDLMSVSARPGLETGFAEARTERREPMKNPLNRRRFLASSATATGAALTIQDHFGRRGQAGLARRQARAQGVVSRLALGQQRRRGGRGRRRAQRRWFRGGGEKVNDFETAYAKMMGAKHCVAVTNGTSALVASLAAVGVEPGDEVIVPPYTFIATVNAVLMQYALPIFVDSDPTTFLIDAKKIEAAITERTKAILPVHIGGNVVDLDSVLEVAKKHHLPVVEDACQAHLAEWRHRKAGSWGSTGGFSFQVTKNLCSGEGGAILTNDDQLALRCSAFQNNCRARAIAGYNFNYTGGRGANLRMTEFQGALLLSQMARIEKNAQTRDENARYLTSMLAQIPGILPAKTYENCTRNAYHLYMLRYKSEAFGGLPRSKFLAALSAEGIPCSSGYSPLNKESFLRDAFQSRGFQRVFSKEVLDRWAERTACPQNDQLCQEGVWFFQTMLLGMRDDMEQIATAIRKIHAHCGTLAKA